MPAFSFRRRQQPRPLGAVAVAVGFNALLLLFLAQTLQLPAAWTSLFRRASESTERIQYVATPPAAGGPSVQAAPRAGGDGLAPRQGARSRPLVAPADVPSALPAVPEGGAGKAPAGGTGAVIGGGGPTAGLVPRYTQPSLWATPGPAPRVPRSNAEQLDSILAFDVARELSLQPPPGRALGDWTTERNGSKYGVDQKYIHLGKFSIPTAVLALLPLNVTGNPTVMDRERRLASMRLEINEQASRAMSEDDFRSAVRNIRERTDRERAERRAKEAAESKEVAAPDR